MAKADLTVARLREVLRYAPETGHLTWVVTRCNRAIAGRRAGTVNWEGYRSIQLDGYAYPAHRLAWYSVHGKWPIGQIDHINGEPDDNRIGNLRDVTPQVNSQNRHGATSLSKTGVIGAYRSGQKFMSYIEHPEGRRVHLGTFATAEDAHQAYLKAKRELHEGCTL